MTATLTLLQCSGTTSLSIMYTVMPPSAQPSSVCKSQPWPFSGDGCSSRLAASSLLPSDIPAILNYVSFILLIVFLSSVNIHWLGKVCSYPFVLFQLLKMKRKSLHPTVLASMFSHTTLQNGSRRQKMVLYLTILLPAQWTYHLFDRHNSFKFMWSECTVLWDGPIITA